MKVVAVVQARMGSVRFPGKVMRLLCGTPMIGFMLERLSKASLIDQIVLATSLAADNDPLESHVKSLGIPVFRGSENDVLDRYYQAAKSLAADVVVRVTGDCPLIDPVLVDEVIVGFLKSAADYGSNVAPPTFPNGLDTEVFTFKALESAWQSASTPHQREHVTPFLRESGLHTQFNFLNSVDESAHRWTVDEPEDFAVVERVVRHFHPRRDFSWTEILALNSAHPAWFEDNRHLMRNAGASLSVGQKLQKRAQRVLFPEAALVCGVTGPIPADRWPWYFSRAEGCRVWDLAGTEYIDMAMRGSGASTLGYGCKEVDDAVRQAIAAGNGCSLRCAEEVYLAEKLIELHPWADGAQLTVSREFAVSAAIHAAWAATGKSGVVVCGASELRDAGQSMRVASGQELRVPHNDFQVLQEATHAGRIGVIWMELAHDELPDKVHLERVRALASQSGAVLIFDERVSGFRQTFGGLHKMYEVEPDLAVFGEAIGNGYQINAIIGRRGVMQEVHPALDRDSADTQRIGPAAALKTLAMMQQVKSWEQITSIGVSITDRWRDLARRHGLEISTCGLPALARFSIVSQNASAYQALIIQEMLGKGFLAGTGVCISTAHVSDVQCRYFEALEPVFALIAQCEAGRDVRALLAPRIGCDGQNAF